jgi:uncharacterized protein DUF6916
MTGPQLTLADFSVHQGEAFAVEAEGGPVPLLLAEAKALPESPREGGAFRLEFEGPLQPELGQGVYRFRLGERDDDIFIVPIARTAEAMRYEAVFF